MNRKELFNLIIEQNLESLKNNEFKEEERYFNLFKDLQDEVRKLDLNKEEIKKWKDLVAEAVKKDVFKSFDNKMLIIKIMLYLRFLNESVDNIQLNSKENTLFEIILSSEKDRFKYVPSNLFNEFFYLSKGFINQIYGTMTINKRPNLNKFEKKYSKIFTDLFNHNLKSKEFNIFVKNTLIKDFEESYENNTKNNSMLFLKLAKTIKMLVVTAESKKSLNMNILKEVMTEKVSDLNTLFVFSIIVEKYPHEFFKLDVPAMKELYEDYYKEQEKEFDKRFDSLSSNEKIKLHDFYYEENQHRNLYIYLKRKLLNMFTMTEKDINHFRNEMFKAIDQPLLS